MKQLIFLFFIWVFFVVKAQNHRIIYDYTFSIDSTNLSNKNNELMALDVYDEHSKFYSYQNFIQDSLFSSLGKNGPNLKVLDMSKAKVKFSVSKNLSKNEVVLHEKIGAENYRIIENEKISWKIENEKKLMNDILVQKATTTYIGRDWVAWFSTKYPINDGPYKFYGLPGLIIEMYDVNQNHVFKFVGIKEVPKVEYVNKLNESNIDYIKFNKLWKEYKVNPSKFHFIPNMSNDEGSLSVSVSMNGKTYNSAEMLRQIEIHEKAKLKTINNFLDLKLFK